MTIQLERSLVEQFPDFMDVVRASIYDCGRAFKAIAADLDMSVSELSRRLSTGDALPAVMADLPRLIDATKDHRPVYWLVERFLESDDTKQRRVVEQLSKAIPEIASLLSQLQSVSKP